MYFNENNNYFDSMIFTRDNTLFTLDEGFNKGNMFENIYSKYKNHVYKLKVSNKKDELLYKIQMYTFALKDINLYLDVNPSDDSMIEKYNELNSKLKSLREDYSKEYGPLCASENDQGWEWISNPWPWDKGGKE